MLPWAFHVSAAPLGAHLKPLGPDVCGCTGRAVSPSPNSIPALAPWKESSLSLVSFALSIQVPHSEITPELNSTSATGSRIPWHVPPAWLAGKRMEEEERLISPGVHLTVLLLFAFT